MKRIYEELEVINPEKEGYIHKSPSKSVKFKNKFDYILNVEHYKGDIYRVKKAEYGAISLKGNHYDKYGYVVTTTLLTKDEIYRDFGYEVKE